MAIPNLLSLSTEEEYRQHYIEHYCNVCPIYTFDKIPVSFYPDRFEHAFYQRSIKCYDAQKDIFSIERAQRMDWIQYVLQNPSAILKIGYDKERKTYDNSRRVALLSEENYLVVIFINPKRKAKFITAFVIDDETTLHKIITGPDW